MEKIKRFLTLGLIALVFFAIPIEHKYDKLFRFYSLTLLPNGLDLHGAFDPGIYFYISDFVGILLLVSGLALLRRRLFERGGIFLAIFFGCALGSIIVSPLSHYPVAYIRLLQLLTPISIFCFLANGPLSKERLFPIISWTLFGTGLSQALVAIVQYFTQHALGLRLIGEQPLNSVICVPNGHRWLLDQGSSSSTIFRAMGTMPHSNVLGGLLALCILITGYLFFKHSGHRKWLAIAYCIELFGLGITYSRSAIFAYFLSTVVWLLWMRYRQQIAIRSCAILVLISCSIVGVLLHEQYLYRGGIVNSTSLSRASDQIRLDQQTIAFQMIQRHPIAGVGYQQFALNALSHQGDSIRPPTTVHNIYLLIASETGLFSLALFLGWIGILLRAAWRAGPLPETGLLFAALIGFLFIGGCDYYLIFFQQGKLLFFGTAGWLAQWSLFSWKTALARA